LDFEHAGPFTVYPGLRRILGSYSHVILLSRIIYDADENGVLITTNKELAERCCLTEREVQYSKRIIKEKVPFVKHTWVGFPRRSRYSLDLDGCREYMCDQTSNTQNTNPPPKKKSGKYPPDFEEVWRIYTPALKNAKGVKSRAYKAYQKAREEVSHVQIIAAVRNYMDSLLFEKYPAHLATFLNGIISNTKYREFLIGDRRDKAALKPKRGALDARGLIRRTDELQKAMFEKYGVSPTIIEHRPRKEWVKMLGEEYVAVAIPHYMNKNTKVRVLFHIDELREDLYTHLHGLTWSDKLEQEYQESNRRYAEVTCDAQ